MIPSLLQIPSAVSDSKLHSVLPNNGKGDFTFDRSTGATRINKDGLIEEVGYFSSELVQNGNFSELGSELITNGDFATNSDWSDVNNVSSIINGQLVFNNNSFGGKFQNTSMVVGKTYKLVYTIVSISNGYIQPRLGDTGLATQRTSAGTYTEYVVCAVDSIFRLYGASSDAIVDNVSVKQVDPNDRWTLGTGWSYGTNKAEKTAGTGSILSQSNVVEANKKYKVSFDVVATAGYIDSVFIGGQSEGTNITASGSYSYIFDATNTDSLGFNANSAFAGSVTNISVVEVQGDRPRLSYDITNGVVEDKPHLLLEPSSTNLVTHSNDTTTYSHYNYGGGLIVDSYGYLSPDGTQNASRLVYTNSSTGSGGALLTQNITLNATGTYTISLYAKSISGTKKIRISPKNTGSQGTAGFIINMTSEWQRFTHTFTNDGGTGRGFQFRITETEDSGDRTFDVWGMTIEEGSFATSVIPTAGTTITRAAETCNNSKPSVNSTEGVLYAEIAALANDLEYEILSVSDGSTNNRAYLQYTNVSNQIKFVYKVGGATQAGIGTATFDIVNFHKIACKWKANDFALWIDGNEVGTDTSGSVNSAGTFTQVNFDDGAGNTDFYGKVKGLAVYNEALSESQLMQLTGVTASSIYSNFVTRTASFTVEALNEVKKVIDNL